MGIFRPIRLACTRRLRWATLNMLSSAAIGGIPACGGTSDNGLCTSLAAGDTDYHGCKNVAYDAAVHPCEAEVTAACNSDATCASDRLATCATTYYLRNYATEALPACDSSKPILPINAEVRLALYRYSDVSDENTVRHTQGLQRYFEPHNLTMTTSGIAAPERIRYALDGTIDQINQAMIDVGISPNATALTPEEEQRATIAVGNVMFAPTKAFFAQFALPAEPKVNIAVISQIVSPTLASLMDLGDKVIVGLGLSPALLARTQQSDPNGASLVTMLQVDSDFTPTLFVGHTDIARLAGNFDMVVAHEMGHALGLEHVESSGNLMEQGGSTTCRHWLSQAQIDLMGPFADMLLTDEDALVRILASRRTVVAKVLEARRVSAQSK